MGFIRHSGSEVMGLMGSGLTAYTKRRLSENPGCPTVFVTAFFCISKIVSCPRRKVKCFRDKERPFFAFSFVQDAKKSKIPLTNGFVYGKMTTVHILKTLTEILLLSEVPESRRLV